MQQTALSAICAFFVAITVSGCAGLIVNTPVECKNETPFTCVHDIFWKPPSPKRVIPVLGLVIPEVPTPKASTKVEFLKDWGKPDDVISTSENEETWIYNRRLWCGAIPFFILPVPLILPVCDGFDRIEFKGYEAQRLHTIHIVPRGFVIPLFPPFFPMVASDQTDPACRLPLSPINGSDAGALKPATQGAP